RLHTQAATGSASVGIGPYRLLRRGLLDRWRANALGGAQSANGGCRLGGGLAIPLASEIGDAATKRAIGPRGHEGLAGVERGDRAAILVDHLVVDLATKHRLGVLDVDAGERVRSIQHELHLG